MPAGAQVCRPHGLELLVSSSLNSSWVPAVVAYRSSASTLVLQAPDGSAGCEQTLAAVRYTHRCPALLSWDKTTGGGPCTPALPNCSVYSGRGTPLLPFEMNLTTTAAPATAEPPAPTPDLEWTKWVRVSWWAGNSQPAWLDRDAARQYALDTLQPDIVDWYQVIQTEQLSIETLVCRTVYTVAM